MKTFVRVFIVPINLEPISHAEYWRTEAEINDFAEKHDLTIISISEHQEHTVWVVFQKNKKEEK